MAVLFLANIVSAHPWHAPTHVVAEFSQPLAGLDHLLVFGGVTSVLLVALRFAMRLRQEQKTRGPARCEQDH